MKKKNIVILGGTSGVGKAIAQSFKPDEANLIIVGRNEAKAKEITLQSHGSIAFVLGDLVNKSDQLDVVDQIEQQLDQVDVLIDTFGVFPSSAQRNIRYNLQAHAEMIQRLIPLLSKAKQARIAIVTGHQKAITLAPICERQASALERGIWEITHKTLLMTLLADKLAVQNIMVNSFYPGEVQSDLMGWTKHLHNHTVTVGRFLALSDSLAHVSGKMFNQFGKEITLPTPYLAERSKIILAPYLPELT